MFQTNSTNLDRYINILELDTSQEGIKVERDIKPFENSYIDLKLSYFFNKNLYASYSYSKKGKADMNSLEFGILF